MQTAQGVKAAKTALEQRAADMAARAGLLHESPNISSIAPGVPGARAGLEGVENAMNKGSGGKDGKVWTCVSYTGYHFRWGWIPTTCEIVF
jgi:hypothetical protein